MKASYRWLQSYFDAPLPSPEKVAELLTFHSFEVETIGKTGDDFVFDIDILPNRAHDCLSHLGIARELSVLLEIPLKRDVLREKVQTLPTSSRLTLSIVDTLNAPRHMAAFISGVTVKESPEWLRRYLESIGQRSINNIVDATNYVMFALGQPTHVFDADTLTKKDGVIGITIRRARKGERVTLLGGDEYILDEEMLVLADTHSGVPLDIAGIKGGVSAELTEKTSSLVLSAANFKGASVRKTSQRLKLRTEASVRFENELAPELSYYGITEVIQLIQDIAGGEVEGYIDTYPIRKSSQYKIGVSVNEVNALLGTNITGGAMEHIFSRLKFPYEKLNPLEKVLALATALVGMPYKYGASISYDAPHAFDCSSFVGYVFAQAGVSLPRIAIDQYVYGSRIEKDELSPGDLVFSTNEGHAKKHTFTRVSDGAEVEHVGAAKSSQEFLAGTKVDEGVSHCGIYVGDGRVIHASSSNGVVVEDMEASDYFKNIISYRRVAQKEERYVVTVPFERLDLRARTSFLTSGNKEDLIEEIGRVYGYQNVPVLTPKRNSGRPHISAHYYYAEKIRCFLTNMGFTEVYTYSMRDFGRIEIENPIAGDKSFLRDGLRYGIEESIACNQKNLPLFDAKNINLFEIGKVFGGSTKDLKEYTAVCIGSSAKENAEQAAKALSTKLGMSLKGTWSEGVFEFNLDAAILKLPTPGAYEAIFGHEHFSYTPFSVYPFALRDIAVWVPEGVSAHELTGRIKECAGILLARVALFDEYKKDGRISYAFRLVFQSREKTLSDKDVKGIMDAVIAVLNKQEGFEVR